MTHHREVVANGSRHGDFPVCELARTGDEFFYVLVSKLTRAGTALISDRAAQGACDHPQQSLPRRRYCALASRLPTERYFCRSGRTAHGTAVFYSTWHTHIACAGVVVLYQWGFWPFPACPRTYLRTSTIKARPLPSSVLSCTPSQVLRTSRTPSWLRATSAFRPYSHGLCLTWLPGRVSPVPCCSFTACHRLRPRRGPAFVPVRNAVCCLRREMSGSALSNTFRLKI